MVCVTVVLQQICLTCLFYAHDATGIRRIHPTKIESYIQYILIWRSKVIT